MNDNETTMATDELTEIIENQSEISENQSEKDPLAARVAQLEAQLAEQKDKFLRQAAEFENAKRRTARENLEIRQTAGRDVLSAMLPILDDFDRANQRENFSEGIQLIYQKFQTTLAQRGLRAMDSTGADFNPDEHEAITEIPAPTDELRGKVIDTTEKGYFLNDKIIRFAKVVVGK